MLPLHPGGPDASTGVTVLDASHRAPAVVWIPPFFLFFFSARFKLDGSPVVLALTVVLFIFRVPQLKQCTRSRRGSRCVARLAGGRHIGHAHRRYDVTRQL